MSEMLLGQSYFLRFDPKLWQAMQPYPPLGTLYAASTMRSRGYEVALFDAMLAESEADWDEALQRHGPRFAVLYEDNFNYLSKMCLLRMRQAALTMIEMARKRGCTVVVAGSDATDHADLYLARGADFVLIGEGEETLGELMDRLTGRSQTPLGDIAGLAYVDDRPQTIDHGLPIVRSPRSVVRSPRSVVRTPRRPDLHDLDALPFPAWDLVQIDRYRKLWLDRHGYFSMNMVTTRGCPFHCNWCAKPIWGQRYHARSPENVVSEMRWLGQAFQPDHIGFADDIFGLKPGWISRFAELLEAEGIRIPFKCLNRADLLLREGEVEALRRAGCQIAWIGAESGAQATLDAMEKGTKVEQIDEAARRLHGAGIRVGFFLQFGYPGETRADIAKTLRMVHECRPDDIGVSVSYPLPGTKFHAAVAGQLGEKQNWMDSSDLAMMYRGPFTTAFYRRLHGLVHRKFRMRNAWYELRKALLQPRTLRFSHLRRAARMVAQGATIPLDWLAMEFLARRPHRSLSLTAPRMTQEAAAVPTFQPDAKPQETLSTSVNADPTGAVR